MVCILVILSFFIMRSDPRSHDYYNPSIIKKLRDVWEKSSFDRIERCGRIHNKNIIIDDEGNVSSISISKIRYDLPGVRFHTHPKTIGDGVNDMDMWDELTPPSASDYYLNFIKGEQELVLTQYGVWVMTPSTVGNREEILPGLMLYVNSAAFYIGTYNRGTPETKKNYIHAAAKKYSEIMTAPSYKIINTPDFNDAAYATNKQFGNIYNYTDQVGPVLESLEKIIKTPPVKIDWIPWK